MPFLVKIGMGREHRISPDVARDVNTTAKRVNEKCSPIFEGHQLEISQGIQPGFTVAGFDAQQRSTSSHYPAKSCRSSISTSQFPLKSPTG